MTAPKRGRPPANSQPGQERPPQHRGVSAVEFESLNEMEQNAQRRIEGNGRVKLRAALKLEWNDCEPGFVYQWGSDAENYPVGLQQMLDAGYTFVRYKHGALSGTPVVQNSRGCRLFLMRIPEAWFDADQNEKHEKSIRLYKEVNQVGEREYAGESKELGKGKPVKMEITDTPQKSEALKLMEGDDD